MLMKKYKIEKINSNGIKIPNFAPIWIIELCFTFVANKENNYNNICISKHHKEIKETRRY